MPDEQIKNAVLDILADLTASDDVKINLDLNLFETGLLDSIGTVQLLLELQTQFGVEAPV
ncbi:D-alanine--poly(phosphoribitol) ligase subunit 2, partial [Lacticaseibacillus paracasei]|uniref:D-alanine--poly(phosphoribitol) ligase subunit 2 n=1 Tax=Lacticaseibacillus paracasei TaxID=1597 RepID=UPI0030EA5A7F